MTNTGLSEPELCTAIETYGPELRLHPDEIYFPCSVEALLKNSILHDNKTGKDTAHPVPDHLPSSGGDYWLIIDDSFKAGDLTHAPAYVHAYWDPGCNYTDL
jgi:hypothetical protein